MSLTERFNEMDQAARLKVGYFIAALLVLAIGYSAINDRIIKLEKKRGSRQADLAEMMLLKQRHREASSGAQKLANRLSAVTPDDSVAKLIDEIGIKGKSSQIKPLKGEDRPGFMEDAAEVRIEGLSANDLVNLLFRLEKGVKPVVIKKANFKARYDDPSKLDISLSVALLKPAPQEKK
ncbi:MAG: general secretion pathway protein GspM [Geobacteraceae bacterium]|nr:general secretion pathway protein GspM [Geobacteraceae bacterium]